MAIADIQDISFSSPGVATREEYTDVGASAFHLGTYKRLFNATDFEIWTAASGGTQLTLDTDYELVQKSDWYSKQSAKAGLGDVYTTLKILNATYQTGSIFMTYDWPGTIVETQFITDINSDISGLESDIAAISGLVGEVKAWDKTFPNTPALPSAFVECDGALISDGDSVYDGYRARNLNGANVTFSVVWASGVATVAAANLTALAVGDDVSGGAIAANSYITDITGTTVTISDSAITATVSSTFTNDGSFIRGGSASGVGQKDQFQGFDVELITRNGVASFTTDFFPGAAAGSPVAKTSNALISDGTNGTPRTGTETRPSNQSMVYIMRIK